MAEVSHHDMVIGQMAEEVAEKKNCGFDQYLLVGRLQFTYLPINRRMNMNNWISELTLAAPLPEEVEKAITAIDDAAKTGMKEWPNSVIVPVAKLTAVCQRLAWENKAMESKLAEAEALQEFVDRIEKLDESDTREWNQLVREWNQMVVENTIAKDPIGMAISLAKCPERSRGKDKRIANLQATITKLEAEVEFMKNNWVNPTGE
ncbi:MAG: hypothetical protein E4H01_01975 [Lysobacterales bacterium]|nr:MAG: hypothetical protein E4H01_01975 [Xanthomonadales bacterium]